MRRVALALGAFLFLSIAAQAQVGPPPGSGCSTGAPCNPSELLINGAVNPAVDLGTAGTTRTPQMLFETQANLAAQFLTNTGSDFTCRLSAQQPGGTFHDDSLVYGFNNNVPRVPLAGVWTYSGETDYCYDGVTTTPYSTHAFELNFIATTSAATQATVGGTAASGGTLTLTATGAFVGSPHSISVAAGVSDTISTLAESLASALTSDTTFLTAGFYARANQTAGVLKIFNEVAGNNSCSSLGYNPSCNVAWSKTTTGTATLTIAQAATITSRPMSLNFDRDNGPNGPTGLAAVAFTIGNCTGACAFSVFDTTATHPYLVITGSGGPLELGNSTNNSINGIQFQATGTNSISASQSGAAVALGSNGNTANIYVDANDGIDLGSAADARFLRASSGAFRFQATAGSLSPLLVTKGQAAPSVTSGSTACGTSASIDSLSTNTSGRITVGSSTNGANCPITWSGGATLAAVPVCSIQDETTAVALRPVPTVTGLTINGVIVAGDKLTYNCLSYGY